MARSRMQTKESDSCLKYTNAEVRSCVEQFTRSFHTPSLPQTTFQSFSAAPSWSSLAIDSSPSPPLDLCRIHDISDQFCELQCGSWQPENRLVVQNGRSFPQNVYHSELFDENPLMQERLQRTECERHQPQPRYLHLHQQTHHNHPFHSGKA